MKTAEERARDHAAFRQSKDVIARSYPPGRLVAICGGRIVADAAGFEDLTAKLALQGIDPQDALVVEAGADYPETAIVFAQEAAA
jgi:hypothetical protein